jgi:hypothetical protein
MQMKKNELKLQTIIKFTPEWLRSFKGCEHHSDEEAKEIIDSLFSIAHILLKTTPNKIYNIENQQFTQSSGTKIDLNIQNKAA